MEQLEGDELTPETVKDERRWGFWNWRDITDGQTLYIRRLSIITTPWFSIKLHRIFRPDQQRELHDHPWSFLSIILLGSYVEDTPAGPVWCRWFNWKRAEDCHSIDWVSRVPVWTLVFCGRTRRTWGFWIKDSKAECKEHFFCARKWVRWFDYDKLDMP